MDSVFKYILLAVGLLITAGLVIYVLNINGVATNIFNQGMSLFNDSASELQESDLTQYDGSTLDGGRIVKVIKKYWEADNSIAVCVCTKDGRNTMYDYAGQTFVIRSQLKNVPSVDAKGNPLANSVDAGIIQCAKASHLGIDTYSDVSGYECKEPSKKGYINPTASFNGSIQRDSNETIRMITFVQK